jgi:hypothetical protein
MAGNILMLVKRTADDDDPIAVPALSAYEAQAQITALEAQATANDKILVVIAYFDDFPKPEAGEEDKTDE